MVAAQAAMKKAVETHAILTSMRKTVNLARREAHKKAKKEAAALALANRKPYDARD